MNIAFMVIKNGVKLGYPFIESVASVLRVVDVFFIVDHHSDDKTPAILTRLRELNGKIHLAEANWPKQSSCGSAIAAATNHAIGLCLKKWPKAHKLLYMQADEVFHEKDLSNIGNMFPNKFKSSSFKFLHFRNGFDKIIANPTYNRAIRLISPGAKSIQDGFNFGGDVTPIGHSQVNVFHVGWCFPVHICHKHISHSALYPGAGEYNRAKRVCEDMLRTRKFSKERLCKEVDGQYRFQSFNGNNLPQCIRHLVKESSYDPQRSLGILSETIKNG